MKSNFFGSAALPQPYELILARGCPWAEITLMTLKYYQMEAQVKVTFVEDVITNKGWAFSLKRGDIFIWLNI